jgi:hypothetical protein
MLSHQLFSVRGIFPEHNSPCGPSLETGYFNAPVSWDSKIATTLNLFDAGRIGQSHERGLYP